MPLYAAIAALAAALVAAGALNTGGAARRALGAALGLGLLGLPAVTDAAPLWSFLLSLGCLMVALRSWDLAWEREPMDAGRRIWHLVALYDTRLARETERGLDRGLLARTAVWSLAAAAGLGLCLGGAAVEPGPLLAPLLRYGGFALHAVALFEVASGGMRLASGLVGVAPPRLHEAPYLSTTVREFWGARWNRIIGTWLRQNCFMPLASRGHPALGIAWAFTFSALMHAYLMLAPMGWRWSAIYGLFFVIQIAVMAAERALRVAAWPVPAARAWTWAVMLAASPLFSEPLIRMMEDLLG